MFGPIKWNEGQPLLGSYLLLGFIMLIWCQYYYIRVYLLVVARHYQNETVQRHFHCPLPRTFSPQGNFCFSSFHSKNFLWTSSEKLPSPPRAAADPQKSSKREGMLSSSQNCCLAESSLLCMPEVLWALCRHSSAQQIPCPAALCCLARREFVPKKDILLFPGNIYSRENKLNAEAAWGELHNGNETSPVLPPSASHALGIPTSLGAQERGGKTSQILLNLFEKINLFPFLSSIASSGNLT